MSRALRNGIRASVKPGRSLLLATTAILLAAPNAQAIFPEVPFEQMVADADAIVEGTVVSQTFEAAAGSVFTITTIDVAASMKGSTPSRIEIRTEGGGHGNVAVHAPSEPRFGLGERVVLFLVPDGPRFRTVRAALGKSRVTDGTIQMRGQPMRSRDDFLQEVQRVQ